LRDPGLLQQEVRPDGGIAPQPPGLPVRAGGLLEHPSPVPYIAKRFGDVGNLGDWNVRDATARLQGPAVEVGRFDVRVLVPRAVAGQPGISPRLVVALGMEEVQ